MLTQPTYRRVMARLNLAFVLGLTATPERGDGIDVASIFDDNLAYHATIGDGIAEDSLVPFHYVGIRDTVDFEQIPAMVASIWRSLKSESRTQRADGPAVVGHEAASCRADDRVLLLAHTPRLCGIGCASKRRDVGSGILGRWERWTISLLEALRR